MQWARRAARATSALLGSAVTFTATAGATSFSCGTPAAAPGNRDVSELHVVRAVWIRADGIAAGQDIELTSQTLALTTAAPRRSGDEVRRDRRDGTYRASASGRDHARPARRSRAA